MLCLKNACRIGIRGTKYLLFLVECGASACNIEGCSLYEVQWVQCDGCSTWLHKYCVGLEENDNPSEFICEVCEQDRST